MKLYKYLFLSALAVGTLSSCSDDKEPGDADTVTIIAANGTCFASEGGVLEILVNSNVDYNVEVDADWIVRHQARAVPENGVEKFLIQPYPLAADMSPRVAAVTITYPGLEPQTHTVEQLPGDVYRFKVTGLSPLRIPAKGGSLTVNVAANVEYTTQVSEPEWIAIGEEHEGNPTFNIAENNVPEPRRGLITFHTVELGDTSVEFTQEPFMAEKGISTADQFLAFAAAVNAGTSLDEWINEEEEVSLLADIDMAGKTWVPVGNLRGSSLANGTTTLGKDGHAFTGVFNGNGHTISNLTLETDAEQCYGLFGVCSSATIKNLILDSSCSLKVTNEGLTAGSAYGFIAGLLYQSSVEDVTVNAVMQESVINKTKTSYLVSVGGIAGFSYSSTISGCRFGGSILKVRSNDYHNSTSSGVGGILGFARGTSASPTIIEDCINTGYIYGLVHRVSGILAATTSQYIIRNCENAGVVHASVAEAKSAGWSSGLRVGGVLGFTSNTSASSVSVVENCKNSGTVVCDGDDATYTGGVIGLIRCVKVTNIVNTGCVIGNGKITGLICGQLQCGDKGTINSCVVGGSIATAYTGSGFDIKPVNAITVTADNYFQYAAGNVLALNTSMWNTDIVTFLK